jgi:pimeloyl-ACP methyl ester carboxylesterase
MAAGADLGFATPFCNQFSQFLYIRGKEVVIGYNLFLFNIFRKIVIMRRLLFTVISQAQDIKKIEEDLTKMLSDSTVLYGKNKQAGKFYDIRGFKMYAETYGKGEPLLIIHGNGGSINNFIYQIPYFSQHYKVIIADSRSQGKSMDLRDSLTYEMMADDYAALLTEMKIDSAYVIGWSDGGINGLLLAMRHPEKVKKLAVTGANLVPDNTAVPKEIWDMVRPAQAELKNKANKTISEKAQLKLLNLLCDQPHISDAQLKTISCPTLVIGGDHDVIKVEHTFHIYSQLPRSYLWILPNSGHSTPIVYKDDFNQRVDRFFKTPYRSFDAQARFF